MDTTVTSWESARSLRRIALSWPPRAWTPQCDCGIQQAAHVQQFSKGIAPKYSPSVSFQRDEKTKIASSWLLPARTGQYACGTRRAEHRSEERRAGKEGRA